MFSINVTLRRILETPAEGSRFWQDYSYLLGTTTACWTGARTPGSTASMARAGFAEAIVVLSRITQSVETRNDRRLTTNNPICHGRTEAIGRIYIESWNAGFGEVLSRADRIGHRSSPNAGDVILPSLSHTDGGWRNVGRELSGSSGPGPAETRWILNSASSTRSPLIHLTGAQESARRLFHSP